MSLTGNVPVMAEAGLHVTIVNIYDVTNSRLLGVQNDGYFYTPAVCLCFPAMHHFMWFAIVLE